jgi:hypothetical protein
MIKKTEYTDLNILTTGAWYGAIDKVMAVRYITHPVNVDIFCVVQQMTAQRFRSYQMFQVASIRSYIQN